MQTKKCQISDDDYIRFWEKKIIKFDSLPEKSKAKILKNKINNNPKYDRSKS